MVRILQCTSSYFVSKTNERWSILLDKGNITAHCKPIYNLFVYRASESRRENRKSKQIDSIFPGKQQQSVCNGKLHQKSR